MILILGRGKILKIKLRSLGYKIISMTEGEEFIVEFLEDNNIKYRREEPIIGLNNDTKNYRVADFYLPEYKVYIEFFGQWNMDIHKERYREKKEVYFKNQIPCIHLYPENLGLIEFIFEKRLIRTLKYYKYKSELLKYRNKLLFQNKLQNFILVAFGVLCIFGSYPWTKDRLWLLAGFCIISYQIFLFVNDYKNIFKD